MATALGRLEKVDLRVAWSSEAADFTPWLAQSDNLALLGDAIGIDLHCEAQEKEVGPFRADILCKDTSSDSWVLIENQLERTDHSHLGQLLTYAAGLSTVTIVWIAERFTEEHRAALDWLNEKTDKDINFFGLEVELWRIGDSPVAPKFNIVCQPNEWTRTIAQSAKDLGSNDAYFDFWSQFAPKLAQTNIGTRELKPMRKAVLWVPTGWQNFKFRIFTFATKNKNGMKIVCIGPNGKRNFDNLFDQREAIHEALGQPLAWKPDAGPDKHDITLYLDGYDANDRGDWERQHSVLAEKAELFYSTLKPLIEGIEHAETP